MTTQTMLSGFFVGGAIGILGGLLYFWLNRWRRKRRREQIRNLIRSGQYDSYDLERDLLDRIL